MDRTIKEVIILAGGKGSRLRSEIGEYPKVLAPVNGLPFLDYLLDYLILQGVENVILSVGYHWELIKQQYEDSYKSIQFTYSIENEPLGTGGGVRLALEKCKSDQILVINGDTFFDIELQKLVDFHLKTGAQCSIALKEINEADRYGNVVLTDEKIVRFEEKTKVKQANINGGIYILQKNALDDFPAGSSFSFESDYLEKETSEKEIYGKVFDAYFMDIGVPDDYKQFEKDMRS